MLELRRTPLFKTWYASLRDNRAKTKITARISRLQAGNAGDARPVGNGVSELRIHYGPGYRVYYVQRGSVLIVLLCGGDKATQDQDIATAKALAANLTGDT